jgi:hypothetical protein
MYRGLSTVLHAEEVLETKANCPPSFVWNKESVSKCHPIPGQPGLYSYAIYLILATKKCAILSAISNLKRRLSFKF